MDLCHTHGPRSAETMTIESFAHSSQHGTVSFIPCLQFPNLQLGALQSAMQDSSNDCPTGQHSLSPHGSTLPYHLSGIINTITRLALM